MTRGAISVLCLLALMAPARAQIMVGPGSPCEQAGRDAEHAFALPVGLLDAIGKVESGRWDPGLGRVVASPWAIDAGGQPYLSDNKANALQVTRALQGNGVSNIDVGCFQINLRSHPTAFGDLEQAFDPVANAQYAAKFLASLYTRLGNWQDAVAAYHSATPERGIPYQQAVYANWSAPEGWRQALSAAPTLAREIAEPVKFFSVGGTTVRVWSPSGSSAAAARIPTMPGLPHVITPGG
jgi:hypothetical protein